jgi:hypothetical protein
LSFRSAASSREESAVSLAEASFSPIKLVRDDSNLRVVVQFEYSFTICHSEAPAVWREESAFTNE